MVQIPTNMNSTKYKINDKFFQIGEFTYTPDDFDRDYCGMSGIGTKCRRALQYGCYRATVKVVEPRIQRIFDMGHILEQYMAINLEHIGIKITDKQHEIIGFAGHWKGHIDGKAHNVPEAPKTPHLWEAKTHNNKNFQKVKKDGVFLAMPSHYAQSQRYMAGMGLTRTLYTAYNKDDSSYHFERIRFDKSYADDLIRKEQDVLLAEKLFPRIGNDSPMWHECKFCSHKDVCFGRKLPNVNCRTCQHVDMENGGIWKCGLDKKVLSFKDQKAACDMYDVADLFKK